MRDYAHTLVVEKFNGNSDDLSTRLDGGLPITRSRRKMVRDLSKSNYGDDLCILFKGGADDLHSLYVDLVKSIKLYDGEPELTLEYFSVLDTLRLKTTRTGVYILFHVEEGYISFCDWTGDDTKKVTQLRFEASMKMRELNRRRQSLKPMKSGFSYLHTYKVISYYPDIFHSEIEGKLESGSCEDLIHNILYANFNDQTDIMCGDIHESRQILFNIFEDCCAVLDVPYMDFENFVKVTEVVISTKVNGLFVKFIPKGAKIRYCTKGGDTRVMISKWKELDEEYARI